MCNFRSNVLLDKEFNAVVGDFGFALELPKSESVFTAPLIARTEVLLRLCLAKSLLCLMCTAVVWLVCNHNMILFNVFFVY